ncbi:cation diffusion facilitator family transporter [Modestobacter versicolor]|uniref:Cation diffusion facilitator family transporter n=1 Tax=Modestobacter versicolor TaxID=429133 RepID=A0A323VB65_9ACTN|nr:cation diffusion facilitator family transporter [Modestobacter versicolor]MBB3677674.1 cation diffusion facilitator family transporter [Modestobacter versicolor]PZA20456.1 cation transporter [Modestobacter versicolor]
MTQPAPAPQHALVEEAQGGGGGGESTGTVVVAGLANLAIAVAKLVGGIISHSSAMLSEAAHSLADTVTEVLLFIALKRGNRAADARHPFGYGRETYFWAFLAALCTFGVGAGFSIYQGVTTILEGEEQGSPTISYVILAVSFVLEGSSLLKAVRQVRSAAREHGTTPRRYLRHTTDTTVKAVTFEDSAALVGLVLAALGLFLEDVTGDPVWDGISAILIGVLLIAVAGSLARANISLLIGQSVPGTTRQDLQDELASLDQVSGVPFLLTTVIGPGQLLVAAKVDFADTATVADIERASDEAERRLVARHPGVRYVFLDPTPGDGRAQVAAPPAE